MQCFSTLLCNTSPKSLSYHDFCLTSPWSLSTMPEGSAFAAVNTNCNEKKHYYYYMCPIKYSIPFRKLVAIGMILVN